MFVDARELPAGSTVETLLCIVGAGAAGIALAHEFAGHHHDVCLVESGGFDLDRATQSLYESDNIGLPYFPLDANRQRCFGGSTHLWAGWCRPLDALDFTARAWVPHSGWPITADEVLPYYQRAHTLCELPPCEYGPGDWERSADAMLPTLAGSEIIGKTYRLSPPTRFGQRYRAALARAANVRVLLHANAMELDTNASSTLVTRLRLGTLSGKRLDVRARYYVLAAGGIENARLLLLSTAVQPTGLGNQHDVVGRYFMEHMHFTTATMELAAAPARALTTHAGAAGRALPRLALSAPLHEGEQLLNHSIKLTPVRWYDRPFHTLHRLLARRGHPLHDRLPAAFDPGDALPVALLGRAPARHWRLHLTLEQAPNPDSRVALSEQRDALGLQRVRLEWRTTALDRWTAERVPQLMAAIIKRAGLGRIHPTTPVHAWPPAPLQGLRGHHMGTTRMSIAPRYGVVDPHCRVHGIANLFIAGSSVFPTAGAGTPTLPLIALTLRLADHLKSRAS